MTSPGGHADRAMNPHEHNRETLASRCPPEVRKLLKELKDSLSATYLSINPTGPEAKKQHDLFCQAMKELKDAGF